MFHQRLSILVAAFSLLTNAAPVAASNVLTPQNFEQTIAHGVWFVEHFSPYCRHCRNFEPTWNDLVDHYESKPDPGVHLAQVNCALNGDLCNDNGVTGYPQMNLYRNGVFVEMYNADREFHLLVEFLNKHAQPRGTVDEVVSQLAPSPSPTEQEAIPTPTSTPMADRLVVQTPRSDANPSGTVVSLDVQTFDNFLAQGPVFVKFFAPWCGHCKKLAPTWLQLGRHMQHKLNIAEVDCEQHKALCTSQGVTGFPMLFYYANGVKTEYSGGRSYDQLVSFADKASNPNMQVIDASELDRVVGEQAVFYLLLHDGSDPSLVPDIAKASSVLLGSPPIYVSTAPALIQKYAPSNPSALLAFKDHEAREPVSVFYPSQSPSGATSSTALVRWLHTHRFPSSLELTKDMFQQVMYAPHNPLVVIVATPEGHRATVPPKLADIAQKWRLRTSTSGSSVAGGREVVFTWMDAGVWGKWLKDMYGVKTGTGPAIVVADHERLVYYDKDATGHAITFNSVSVASALDTILTGKAHARESRTMVERMVHALTGAVIGLETWVAAHPYMTGLAVLGLICAVALALRTVLIDDPVDWEAEQRYTKGGRID